MPQSRLPDINTAFIVYRREAISSWKSGNYDSAIGALYAYNSLLPEEYQVKISNTIFEERTNQDITAICNNCTEQTDYKKVVMFDLLLPLTINIIAGHSFEKVWVCPSCKQNNKLLQTQLTQKILQEPYHLQVVQKPPIRREGMLDRTRYGVKFSLWFWSFLTELEAEAARFRDENWNRGGSVYDESDIDTSGEDEET